MLLGMSWPNSENFGGSAGWVEKKVRRALHDITHWWTYIYARKA